MCHAHRPPEPTRSRSLRFTHTVFLTPHTNVSGGCHALARRHPLTVQAWPCWGGDATPAPQLAKHHTHAFSHFESSSHANSRNSPASPIRSLRSRGPFTCCECRRHSINGSALLHQRCRARCSRGRAPLRRAGRFLPAIEDVLTSRTSAHRLRYRLLAHDPTLCSVTTDPRNYISGMSAT